MAIIDLPAIADFDNLDWRPVENVQLNRSQWSRGRSVMDLDNGYFTVSVEIEVATELEDRAWRTFYNKLRGPANSFRLPATLCPQTVITGTGIQAAASDAAGATSLSTKNWANASVLLKDGQYLQIGDQLVMLTADVPTSGTNRTVTFSPPLRAAVATNDAVEAANPKGLVFIPATDGPKTSNGVMTWSFDADEAF